MGKKVITENWKYTGVDIFSEWCESKVPPKKYSQVYSVPFTDDGKIVIVSARYDKSWNIPGGKPEKGENYKKTAIREADEEASIDIVDVQMVGYAKVFVPENSKGVPAGIFNQLRCYSHVKKIKKLVPDPDGNLVRRRKMINNEDFSKFITWGNVGKEIYRLSLKEHKKIMMNRK